MKQTVNVLEVPKHLEHAVQIVQKQVATLRYMLSAKTKYNCEYELEARLGVFENHSFSNGVTKEHFEKIHNMLNTNTKWKSVTPWYKYTDYYYKTYSDEFKIQMDVRTTISEECENESEQHIHHITKRKLCTTTFQTCTHAMRITLAQEYNAQKSIPDIVDNYTYRKKKRKDYKSDFWMYSLSEVTYPGCTTIHYEIEVECINVDTYINMNDHTDAYIALSLLLKMLQMVGSDSTSVQNVEITPLM